ncbi:hypothetical protein ABIG06_006779 [Bradyrhizobium sp. USDA 326]
MLFSRKCPAWSVVAGRAAACPIARRDLQVRKDDERAKPARVPLDPRQDFAKECAGAASLEKDPT